MRVKVQHISRNKGKAYLYWVQAYRTVLAKNICICFAFTFFKWTSIKLQITPQFQVVECDSSIWNSKLTETICLHFCWNILLATIKRPSTPTGLIIPSSYLLQWSNGLQQKDIDLFCFGAGFLLRCPFTGVRHRTYFTTAVVHKSTKRLHFFFGYQKYYLNDEGKRRFTRRINHKAARKHKTRTLLHVEKNKSMKL